MWGRVDLQTPGGERPSAQEREREKELMSAHTRRRESKRQRALAPLFIVFFSPLGLPYANWAWPGALFSLKSSLRSSDLPLTFRCSVFAGFSLPCLLATAILDSCFLFYLPNTSNGTHSSVLAWKIPWMEEPVGSQRVGHHWATSPSKTSKQ